MYLRVISLALIVFISSGALAQSLPEQNWQVEEDFRRDESIVKENIIWLENNPLATATNDTKSLTEFVLAWIAEVPYISVTYDEMFLNNLTNSKKYRFGEKFRITYLLGKSYYVIDHQDDIDEAQACARGIEGMVIVYNELKKFDPSVKHALLEKYSRLVRKNKTAVYTQSIIDKKSK